MTAGPWGLADLHPLPSPRGAALHLIRATQRDDASIEEVVRVARADPSLCGRLIHAANRLNVDKWPRTGALEVAIQRLGFTSARRIALGFSLVGEHRTGHCPAFDYDGFWITSLLRGLAAQALAQRLRSAAPADAFVLGLLLDVGRLALATALPAAYAELLRCNADPGTRLLEAERARFGIDHGELGVKLMQRWMLPSEAVAAAQRHFGSPDAQPGDSAEHGYLVLAERLAQAALASEDTSLAWTHAALHAAAAGGIDAQTLDQIAHAIASEATDWAPLLHLPIPQMMRVDFITYSDPMYGDPMVSSDDPVSNPLAVKDLRILLVDDDEDEHLLLRPILEKCGYRITAVNSADAAIASICDTAPDIVITDWQMPGMSGPELCRTLRRTRVCEHVHLILRTGKSRDQDLVAGIQAGANDFVSKDATNSTLLARVLAGARTALGTRERAAVLARAVRPAPEEARFAATQA